MDHYSADDRVTASVIRSGGVADIQPAVGRYEVACIAADGTHKWHDVIDNLVPNEGKNSLLDTYFAGLAYAATWCMSLISAGNVSAESTYALPDVIEIGNDVIPNRVSIIWTAATSGTKSTAITTFNIVGEGTITGNMVVAGSEGVSTIGNTTAPDGVLLSAGNFSLGDKMVSNGDILNVSYALSI